MTRNRECGEKVQYKTRREAEDGMWGYKRRTAAVRMTVYRCDYCGFWHFGHARRRRR